jgi:hypothetical protein
MDEQVLAENLIIASVLLKGAKEHLFTLNQMQAHISDKPLKKSISRALSETSLFTTHIDRLLKSESSFLEKDMENIEEAMFSLLDGFEEEIKKHRK